MTDEILILPELAQLLKVADKTDYAMFQKIVVQPLGEVVKITGAGQKTGLVHQRVLHANLTFQWQRELKDKFREQFDMIKKLFTNRDVRTTKFEPSGTDEKRWVDSVLARKKGIGF